MYVISLIDTNGNVVLYGYVFNKGDVLEELLLLLEMLRVQHKDCKIEISYKD